MGDHQGRLGRDAGIAARAAMKILFVINVDFSLRHFLLPLMRGARTRGHDVVAACAPGSFLVPVRDEGFRVVEIPLHRGLSPLAQWRAFRALVALMRAEQPDILHAHMPISGFLARAAGRIAGVKVIAYTCHGFLFNQPGSWVRRGVSLALEWFAGCFLTDLFFTVSEAEARDASRLNIARAPIVVGNGRDPALFRPDAAARAAIRATLGVAADKLVIVTVGRLVRHKGFPELVAAMRDVPLAEIWVVGERLASDRGPDMGVALRAAGLGDRLRLLGYRDDVAAIVAAADIFVLFSQFEGLPMSVIEAMLCGLPVVASDIPGLREQVEHGTTGFLVPRDDVPALAGALKKMVAEADLRATMGAAGRMRAMRMYDEKLVVARTLDALGL